MATSTAPLYRKLLRTRWTLLGSQTLWLGPDHLLAVQSHWAHERYQRFYFQDIQALLLSPRDNLSLSIGATLLALLCLLAAFFSVWTLCLLAGLGLGIYTYAFWRGPYCTCSVVTRLGQNQLPSLSRLHEAEGTLAMLVERVREAQGMSADAEDPATELPPPLPTAPHAESARRSRLWLYSVFFAVQIVYGLLRAGNARWHLISLANVMVYFAWLVLVLAVWALLWQWQDYRARSLRWLTAGSVLFFIAHSIWLWFEWVVHMASAGPGGRVTPEAILGMWFLYPTEMIVTSLVHVALGIIGSLFVWRWWLASRYAVEETS